MDKDFDVILGTWLMAYLLTVLLPSKHQNSFTFSLEWCERSKWSFSLPKCTISKFSKIHIFVASKGMIVIKCNKRLWINHRLHPLCAHVMFISLNILHGQRNQGFKVSGKKRKSKIWTCIGVDKVIRLLESFSKYIIRFS